MRKELTLRGPLGLALMSPHADQVARPVTDEQVELEWAAQPLDHFIAQVIEQAGKRADFDATLLAILTQHIVKEDPVEGAVELCVAQIEALAETRASTPKQELPNDGHND